MAKRNRRQQLDLPAYDRSRATVSVDVRLPIDTDLPRKIPFQPPRQRSLWDRAIRIIPRRTRGPTKSTKVQRVTVQLPRLVPRHVIKPSVVMVTDRGVTIAPRRRAKKILAVEPNRPRKDERKFRKRNKHLFGQLDSLRSDTYGLIRQTLDRTTSLSSVATAALITRAINGRIRSRRRSKRRY